MSSKYREPRPKSPERLRLVSIDSVRFDDVDQVTLSATFTYDRWCCHEMHEIVDAVEALYRAVNTGIQKAEKKRAKGLKREAEEIMKELNEES